MLQRVTQGGVVCVAVLVAAMMLSIGSAGVCQESSKVVQVVIAGNQSINSDTIQNAIKLKAGDDYSEQVTADDRAAIMTLGYFVAVTVHKEEAPGGLKITYEVTENPKITGIKVVGSEPLPADKIVELMKTKPGQVLNTTTLNQDIEAIQSYYQDHGYFAYVTADVGPDPTTGVLTVPILVHTVESIEITGNKKTKAYVFLREMKTKPGSVFNSDVLRQDIIRIYNLDILEDVRNYQTLPGSDVGQIRIVIPVQEKKTGQVSVGVGYSSRQRLVGQARLTETNLRGKAQGANLTWEQGTVDTGNGSASYEAGFYEPWVDKKHTSLSVSAYDKLVYRFSSGVFGSTSLPEGNTYSERHEGGDLTLSRPTSETTRVFLGGRFDNVITDPNQLGTAGGLATIAMKGVVTVGSIRTVHNTRDFELDPAAGGYEGLSFEYGTTNADRFDPVTVNNVTTYLPIRFKGGFSKLSVDYRRYFSKGGKKTKPDDKRTTLAVRVRLGYGGGMLPFFEQYFVGGSESLRGYREDRFWGEKMLLTSIELRKPISHGITGVLFLDYGDAWGAQPAFQQVGELEQTTGYSGNYGVGVGMRVATPIGNIRLDYGIGKEGGRTHFSMGHAF